MKPIARTKITAGKKLIRHIGRDTDDIAAWGNPFTVKLACDADPNAAFVVAVIVGCDSYIWTVKDAANPTRIITMRSAPPTSAAASQKRPCATAIPMAAITATT